MLAVAGASEIFMCQQLEIDTMHIVSKNQQEMVSLDNKNSTIILKKVTVKEIRIKP